MDYNFLCWSSNMDDEQRLIAEPISFRNRGVSRKIYNDAFPKEDALLADADDGKGQGDRDARLP